MLTVKALIGDKGDAGNLHEITFVTNGTVAQAFTSVGQIISHMQGERSEYWNVKKIEIEVNN